MGEGEYFRIGESFIKQVTIPGGFLWDGWEPGIYQSLETGKYIDYRENTAMFDYGFHAELTLERANVVTNTWNVTSKMCWRGASAESEVAIVEGLYMQMGQYLAKMKEIAGDVPDVQA